MPKETFFNLPEEKQEKILRSSIHELIRNGYEKANVGEIAKNAGVAKGSMYQYFENKKELYLYSVKWCTDYLMKKFYKPDGPALTSNIFEYFLQNSKDIMGQMREEREPVIFIQDVFLGRYHTLTDESMSYLMKMSEEHILRLIRAGKENGTIRNDIDDHNLCLYIIGVSYKIKENLMSKARSAGEDILDEDYEVYEKDIREMLELLKNGMGGKS